MLRQIDWWLWVAVLVLLTRSAPADGPTTWAAGSGSWTDAGRWDQGVPGDLRTAVLRGKCEITVPPGRHAAGMIRQGAQPGDDVVLRVQGDLVVRRDFFQVGEMTDGRAAIHLDGGSLHAVSAVYLGGANTGPDHRNEAEITVRGGSFLARVLTLGWGSGSHSRFHIEGSRPTAVHLLDAVIVGTEHRFAPSESTLAFTLDRHGVTPITVESTSQGLSFVPGSAGNRARLVIRLSDVPPRDPVTLVSLRRPARGTFDDLPEGARVTASFGGRDYEWRLTYRGGDSGCDVTLFDVAGHADDALPTRCRPVPRSPEPLWREINSRPPLPDRWEPAFDGAEGFGSMARGGRGGRVIEVTSRDDSGPGSLRAALSEKGPRIVRFSVGGDIRLRSPLTVSEPFLTLDGSTAPQPGVTLTGRGMSVSTHDVILRHFRIRPGVPSHEFESDALEFSNAERCIADHLSLAWAADETLSIVGLSDCITVQWCLIAEPLNDRGHAYGSIAGGERSTWHHNLWAHCISRVPRFAGIAQADFRNNVLYDWGHTAGYGQFERVNYLGNFLKPGPSTRASAWQFHSGDSVVTDGSLYLSGNVLAGDEAITRDNARGTGYRAATFGPKPFPVPAVATDPAAVAFEKVLEAAGATLPSRDETDVRILRQTREGTGRILDRVP